MYVCHIWIFVEGSETVLYHEIVRSKEKRDTAPADEGQSVWYLVSDSLA